MKVLPTLLWLIGILVGMNAMSMDIFKGTARSFKLTRHLDESTRENNAEKFETKRDTGNADGFPEEMTYSMSMDGKSKRLLHLVRDHAHVLPKAYQQDEMGKMSRRSEAKKVAFYKDVSGRGLFACQPQTSSTGEFECGMSSIMDVGEETCYIGPGASHADCSANDAGQWDATGEQFSDQSVVRQTVSRTKRGILPETVDKIVEVAYLPDAKFTDLFYRRNPGDIDAAETEMQIFGTLLTNEINVYMSSLKEVSNGVLDVQVYPTAVALPGYKKNFVWSENYNDGTKLTASENMISNLEFTINDSGFITQRYDYVYALTGFNLYNDTTGNPLVSFAKFDTICTTKRTKYALTEFISWNLARILAHELGHALGSDHDGTNSCPSGVNLMSLFLFAPTTETKDSYQKFSTCSVNEIIAHLNSVPACIDDDSTTYEEFKAKFCEGFLGAQDFSLDKQCQRLVNLTTSTSCDTVTAEACYARDIISCTDKDGQCTQKLQFLWNGTPCGTGKICYKGDCVNDFDVCGTTSSSAATTSTTTATPSTTSLPTTSPTTSPSTSTTTSQTTSTTTPPSTSPTTTSPSTTTVIYPCTCCGKQRNKRRKRCCKLGRKKIDSTCYCCSFLKDINPPAGWTGKEF